MGPRGSRALADRAPEDRRAAARPVRSTANLPRVSHTPFTGLLLSSCQRGCGGCMAGCVRPCNPQRLDLLHNLATGCRVAWLHRGGLGDASNQASANIFAHSLATSKAQS